MSYIQRVKMSFRVVMTELERPLLSLSSVAKHRNLDCDRYDKCLNKAIRKNWRSFSCAKCPIFKVHLEERKKLIKTENRPLVQGSVFYEEGFV